MNTYEKLVYLATEPFDNKVVLRDEKGNELKSSLAVLKELKADFINANISVDMRQACETHIALI